MKGLTKMEKNKIEEKAIKTLETYDVVSDCFVDVLELANLLGFVVGNARLDDSEDGFIIVKPGAKILLGCETDKLIGVNSARDFPFKRFIIAHELGHYILAENKEKVFAHRENRNGKNSYENEFDYFAACLLMPKEKFRTQVNNLKNRACYGDKLIETLAAYFVVPVESIKRRFKELNLSTFGE